MSTIRESWWLRMTFTNLGSFPMKHRNRPFRNRPFLSIPRHMSILVPRIYLEVINTSLNTEIRDRFL